MQLFNMPASSEVENTVRCAYNEERKEFEFFTVDKDGSRAYNMGGNTLSKLHSQAITGRR